MVSFVEQRTLDVNSGSSLLIVSVSGATVSFLVQR